jgi:glycosyltransferase involved in cell wall biosynthesis
MNHESGHPLRLVYVGIWSWDTNLRRGAHRLTEAMSRRGHRVAYVEPAVPFPRRRDSSPRRSRFSPSVWLITPRTLPGRSLRAIDRLDRPMERHHVKAALARLGLFNPDVVCVHSPSPRNFYFRTFPSAIKVVRNWDFIEDESYRADFDLPDVALTTSPKYAREESLIPGKTHFLRQCADDHSDVLASRARGDLRPDRRLVAGTLGTFSIRADLQFLRAVIMRCPHIDFVFQGTFTHPNALQYLAAPNSTVIENPSGSVRAVKGFLRRIDVGLLCYPRTEWALHSAPARLLDFLSAGIPVVSTDFAPDALAPFRTLQGFFVSDNEDEFSARIVEAARMGQDPKIANQLASATIRYLAAHVAQDFEQSLERLLEERAWLQR